MINPGNRSAGASEKHSGDSTHPPGIRDVAASAGVSTATVSRALRGLPCVSSTTRQKVVAAAAKLGYVASAAAAELARGRGGQNATFREKRVEPPVSSTTRSPMAGPLAVSEQLLQQMASAHSFTACVMSCDEAGTPDTVLATDSAVKIVINTDALSPASTGLHHALASAHVPMEIHINSNIYYTKGRIRSSPLLCLHCRSVLPNAGGSRTQPDTDR